MCFKSKTPKAPEPVAAPAPLQEVQESDVATIKDKNTKKKTGMAAGSDSTLLTGPSGLDPAALTTSKSSLLGQ